MSIYVLGAPENYPVGVSLNNGFSTVLFNNAPFYLNSLIVYFTPSGGSATPLTLGVDYEPALLFNAATSELGSPVYGGISFVNTVLVGTVSVQYAPLGFGYTITPSQIQSIEANVLFEPYLDLWENTVPGYTTFPKTPLAVNIETQHGVNAVITAINALASTLTLLPAHTSVFNFNNHVAATNNPHIENALTLGIGNVPNWGVATSADIVNKAITGFVTPAALAGAVGSVSPKASATNLGMVELNTGSAGAPDGLDASKVLTAAGLEALLTNGYINISSLTNNQQAAVQFSPFPIPYPITWRGVVCNNFADLVAQVQIATGISPLTSCAKTGSFYFPNQFNLTGFTGL